MPKQKKPAVKFQWRGLHHYRYEREPLEEKFALAWQKINEDTLKFGAGQIDHLDQLLSLDQHATRKASLHDHEVAATVIQWLGSEVGQAWLKGVLGGK